MEQIRFFCKYKDDGFWWFRIFGYGLCGKDLTRHFLLFSERNGYTKTYRFGKWSITILKPKK